MRLYVEPMDAVLVDVDTDGRVKFEGEDWTKPTIQEQRAILYAAENAMADLQELIQALERASPP